jgi:hypothetical protein
MSGNKSAALAVMGIILGAFGLGLGALNIINLQSINIQNIAQSDYSARGYRNGNTGQTTSGWITVYLNAESYDPGNNFDITTYTYTVPKTGKYLITATVTFSDAVDTRLYKLGICVNGTFTSIVGVMCSSTGELSISFSDILSLSMNDIVYVRYNNPAVDFLTIIGTTNQTFMAMTPI